MTKRTFTSLLLAIFFACRFATAQPSTQQTTQPQKFASDRILVFISLDGLAAYYLDDPKAEMPNVRALAADGARASSMKVSAPTVTWTNHATLMTGDIPAHHGVLGNNYYNRTTNKQVALISDPVFDKDQIVKVPTIYDLAKAAGFRTAAIRWPASRNAHNLDWTVPDVAIDDLLHKYTTPALFAECNAAGIWADGVPQEGTENVKIVSDDMVMGVFKLVLEKHRPNLAMLHLINIDHIEHLKGPRSDAAYVAVKKCDAQVGEIWDELKKDYPGKATLIVVSDHGFSANEHQILPNVILRNAGLVDVKGIRVTGGPIRLVSQGGAAFVYVLDTANRDSIMDRVSKAFDGLEGIQTIVRPEQMKDYGMTDPKDDPRAPDMVLFAKESYFFGDTAGGVLPMIGKPERKGSHGHDPALPDLHAVFVAWGVRIEKDARLGEIQNTDVAPTIAKLMGFSMPNVDGKPLDAALSK